VFETGIAATHLGWNRIILLFSEQSAKFEHLPFDFDRHRISRYTLTDDAKKLEGRIEPLTSLLVKALRLIASNRPKRPHELKSKSAEEIKRDRDVENIKWFFRPFSVGLLDIHLTEVPYRLHSFALFMRGCMEFVLSRSSFKLYDQPAYDLICSLTENLKKTLRYDHLYRDVNTDFVQRFGRRVECRDFREEMEARAEEMEAAAEIRKAAAETRGVLNELVEYVRNEYISIDIDETSTQCAKEYSKAIGKEEET